MVGKQKNLKTVMISMVILSVLIWALTALNHQRSPGLPSPDSGGTSLPRNTTVFQGIAPTEGDEPTTVIKKIVVSPVLQYENSASIVETATPSSKVNALSVEKGKTLTRDRKKRLGIYKSLDLIVRPNERFTIGETTVSMRDILAKAVVARGGLLEEEIHTSGEISVDVDGEYGIYVVQSGDNIWNIHFKIIQEYFSSRGAEVIRTADEPVPGGRSSGVGKLLKFSEKMVIIYNLLEGTIASDINLLEPLSKIVVYNMHEIFSLLQEIDYENVDKIQFDGNAIWIPAKQP